MLAKTLPFLLLLATATAARAATVQVANNGLDDPACGTKDAPCRSISRGIANAVDGDTIVVGPGRYGDLDRDGTLSEPNEEGPSGIAMIFVGKRVAIESSGGAAVTIIDVGGGNRAAIRFTASGARLGRPKKGFTIIDSTSSGVTMAADVSGITIEGNLVLDTANAIVTAGLGGHVVQGNVIAAGAFGVGLGGEANGTVARANLAVANTGDGFGAGGAGNQRFEGNVALGNDFGFSAQLYDQATVVGGAAIGNRQGVFGGSGNTYGLSGLAVLANVETGVHNQSTASMSVSGSNFVGNGAKNFNGGNCGTVTENPPLTATNDFFGSASGPGADPADRVCDGGGGVTTADPFATKPFKVKTKVPQL